jgi:hypothetical protein
MINFDRHGLTCFL